MLYKLGVAFCLCLLVYIVCLYFVLKSSLTDISDQEPFKAVVGMRVKTVVPVLVIRPDPAAYLKNDLVLVEKSADQVVPPETIVAELPLNSEVFIQRAWLLKNGTSGFSTLFLSGEVQHEALGPKPVAFDYSWGKGESDIWNKPDVYSFPKSFWQSTELIPNQYKIKPK